MNDAVADVASAAPMRNALTVDVEEYFQVQALSCRISRRDWLMYPSRVEQNVERLLELFAERGAYATFFTLGWIAERNPALIRRVVEQGHELASHGWAHHLVRSQSPAEFRSDVRKTKRILENVSGAAVSGYRAASFSIDKDSFWAFDVLAEEGYRYSSSIYPVRHDLYGMPNAPRTPFRPGNGELIEIPMTTLNILGQNLPASGGGYFRLLPYPLSRWALQRVNGTDRRPAIFYIHPWEIDPDQPRPPGLPLKSRFRHYLNLGRTEGRLRRLLTDFAWDRVDRVFLGPVAAE